MSRIYMSEAQQTKMFAQLEAAYPNEGAGFLLGHLVEGHIAATDVVIDEVVPVENTAEEQHHRFVVTPQDWARLEDLADERGLQLIGCYHSHPDSPALPSDFDKAHSLPNFLYVIVTVEAGKAGEMGAFELTRDGERSHALGIFDESSWQWIMEIPPVR